MSVWLASTNAIGSNRVQLGHFGRPSFLTCLMLSFFAADFSWQLAEAAFVQLEALVLTVPIFRLLLDQERRP